MSRRRPKAEIQFGSDSFLDVVANLVGILIILIVTAGLKVSKIPAVTMPDVKPAEIDTSLLAVSDAPADSSMGRNEAPPTLALDLAEDVREEKTEKPPLPELEAPQELIELTEQLESEIAAIKDEDASLAKKMKKTGELRKEIIEQHKTLREQLKTSLVELEETRKQSLQAQGDLEIARESLQRLVKEYEALENKPVHVETIEHKVTPVSRVVNGPEKHYRLEHNRVVEVPIEELLGRLREQIDRKKDWLIQTRQHKGQVGPVRGFQLQYLVQVKPLSPMDDYRTGYGGYQIGLSSWEILPEPEAKGESETEALRKGSNFYLSLIGAPTDTTLTFWVYPDSFSIYRKLQKFTHEHGFAVAGRPLPPGAQIAGSPNGSRSAGQ